MRRVSKEAKKLLKEIESELRKCLPADEHLKSPMRAKDRREWSDHMMKLIFLIDNIIYLEQSYTMPHNLYELGALSELTSERVRQVEVEAVKKVCKNNTKESLQEFKEAVEEFSNSKNEKMTDLSAECYNPSLSPQYIDHNGKAKSA
jgi:DNA-directed RNA polymerase sigma subunit (sigma70/sigma32)